MSELKPLIDKLKAKKAVQDEARADWAKADKKVDTVKGLKARIEAIEKLLGLIE